MAFYVRRNIWKLTSERQPWNETLIWYAKAVGAMRARPDNDPTSWTFQAAVHGTHLAPESPEEKWAWRQCQHATWYFLPWHRIYLYYFERIVRNTVIDLGGPTDWALPYWGYQPDNVSTRLLPPAFRAEERPNTPTDDIVPNELFTEHRSAALNSGQYALPSQATDHTAAFLETIFAGTEPNYGFGGGESTPWHLGRRFTGRLESVPHNVVHVQVGESLVGQCDGGWMIDPNCAALDPIFWLHHANIDRLWVNWIQQGHVNPAKPTWRDRKFRFIDDQRQQVERTPSEVVETTTLEYVYDDHLPAAQSRRRERGAAPTGGPAGQPELLGASAGGVELTGESASVSVPLADSGRRMVRAVVADLLAAERAEAAGNARPEGPSSGIYLLLEGLVARRVPGVGYEVYLNLPERANEAERTRYQVGVISFFGMGEYQNGEAEQGPHQGGYSFDVTGLVAQLVEDGRWYEDQVTVTLLAFGLERVAGPAADEREVAYRPDFGQATIGRVALLRG